AEGESASALYRRRRSVNADRDRLEGLYIIKHFWHGAGLLPSSPKQCCNGCLDGLHPVQSKSQSAFTGGIGHGANATVVTKTIAVEHNRGNIRRTSAIRNCLPYRFRGFTVTRRRRGAHILFRRRCRGDRPARKVIDHLSINVLLRSKNRQARPARYAEQALPQTTFATGTTLMTNNCILHG